MPVKNSSEIPAVEGRSPIAEDAHLSFAPTLAEKAYLALLCYCPRL